MSSTDKTLVQEKPNNQPETSPKEVNNDDTNKQQNTDQEQAIINTNEVTSSATNNKEMTPTTPSLSANSSFLPTMPMSTTNLVIVSIISIVMTLTFISHTKTHPEFYTQNVDLSAGQVMTILAGAVVATTFAGFHLLVLKEWSSPSAFKSLSSSSEQNNSNNNDSDDKQQKSAQQDPSSFAAAIRRLSPNEKLYNTLFAAMEFTLCLSLFFICDRTKFLERTGKKYDRDMFWFLCLLLLIGGLASLKKAAKPKVSSSTPAPTSSTDQEMKEKNSNNTSIQQQEEKQASSSSSTSAVSIPPAASSSLLSKEDSSANNNNNEVYHVPHLQRDQTEEWKGWMQVMFLWYHYFNAKEIYNVIRLFIAAYVWMTGFGNFSYYYMRKDFSLLRFCHMQWRLNFLVLWVCLLMQNEYMLYYICMLHTVFTVFIYIGLGIKSEMNQSIVGCWTKFGLMTAASLLIWDVPGIFEIVWAPLAPLVQFHNPYKTSQDPMYEWKFRSHLDHLVWVFGMICAFFHPNIESLLKVLDNSRASIQYSVKAVVVGISLGILYIYYTNVFSLDKIEYNKMHPYTSFIPIAIYIVLRNISQIARQYHLHLFEWLGKITLETYISQYHIWMATTGINGSPKKLLAFLPKQYPMLNFAVFSGLTLFVSFKLFNSTNALKSYFLPSSLQPEALRKELITMAVGLIGLYAFAYSLLIVTKGSSSSASTSSKTGGD